MNYLGFPSPNNFVYSQLYPPLCFVNADNHVALNKTVLGKEDTNVGDTYEEIFERMDHLEDSFRKEFVKNQFFASSKQFYQAMDNLTSSINPSNTKKCFFDVSFFRTINDETLNNCYLQCGMTLAEFSLYLVRHLHVQHVQRNKKYRINRDTVCE